MNDMDLRNVLIEIHTALDERGIDHALIGGLALTVHGAARATIDLDFLADGERDDDVDELMRSRGYECLYRSEKVGNYLSEDRERGRIGSLFVRRILGRAILDRANRYEVLGQNVRVVDAADLIGLKVQAYSNDPRRRNRDLADIQRVLRNGNPDRIRVREYFQLFDCEKDLEALLAADADR